MCLARLALVCTSTRDIISEYNSRTKRIFPARCGGFDHEHHMFWTTYKRERAAEPSSLSSQADDTSYRPSSPSTINDEDTNNNWTSSLSPSSYDTNTYPSSSNSNTDDDTNPRLTSPSTFNGETAQSAIPIYRFRSATLRARTTRLTNESTKSAQPRHSPPRRYDTPLASDARNGRKHTYNLRHRQTKSNTG